MLVSNIITDDLSSLDIPPVLIELIKENSLNRERLMKMTIDELAFILNIDVEAAKLIINSVANYSSLMLHDMRELR